MPTQLPLLPSAPVVAQLPKVPGLSYVPGFLSPEEETALLAVVDAQPWRDDLQRRVQHYGWRYDYSRKTVDASMNLGPLPDWLKSLSARLVREKHSVATPDQAIVNEYEPGQGIRPHIDCVPCFGPTVLSLSLGSGCLLELSRPDSAVGHELYLEPRSLLVLTDEARYHWRHGIPLRRSDEWRGEARPRGRRVSLTFRQVVVTG
jgi:alkylated DNA repair dioxygenase AlkB